MNNLRRSIGSHFRRTLVSGLLLLIPVALTYVIIRFLFDLVDGFLRPGIQWILGQFGIALSLPGPGIIAAVIIIYLIGAFATFKIGRSAVDWGRTSLLRVPFVGTIYSANRQLIESFSGTSVTGFKRVVLVEFPRNSAWSLGFLTGITNAQGGEKLIMTYVPTAPLPNSGFVVLMPPQDVLDTDLSVPEAMQLIFSGGIVSPRNINTRKIDVVEVEKQIREMDLPDKAITQAVGESVTSVASKARTLSVRKLRRSSAQAVRAAGAAKHGSASVARDAMIGAVQAVESLGAPSVGQVTDATKGVVLGVRDATGVTTRILHDAVVGAVHGGKGRDTQNTALQGAAEGTMQVASSVGIPSNQAAAEISRAAVDALEGNEEGLIEGGKATLKGVIAGAAAARENVPEAAQKSANELVSAAIKAGELDPDSFTAALAAAAAESSAELSVDSEELANAVSRGSLEGRSRFATLLENRLDPGRPPPSRPTR